jgi:hypothetical protein
VDDSAPLTGVDLPAPFRKTLELAAPIYRRVWWHRHSGSNQARIEELQDLLIRCGRPVSDMLTGAYQRKWPETRFIVQISAYCNWAGAYSVASGPIVMASTDEGTAGSEALEAIFHEAMHQLLAAAEKGAISAGRPGPRRQCSVAATGHRPRWNWFQREDAGGAAVGRRTG